MAEDEDMQEHTSGDAGASLTYPTEAGSIKKNGMIIMKDVRPCKVRYFVHLLPELQRVRRKKGTAGNSAKPIRGI
eukprot:SAG11_NODE_13981_length_630_cov_1.015066_1_plen_75_part_00